MKSAIGTYSLGSFISRGHNLVDQIVGGSGLTHGVNGDRVSARRPLGTSFLSLSPQIGQLFFVGDGLTGTGSGSVQQFLVPPTATRLYLGFADAVGYMGLPGQYQDNVGILNASFQIVPEPRTWALLSLGFTLLYAIRLTKRCAYHTLRANEGCNAPDMPTSVRSGMAREQVEPPQPGKANDERRQSLGAFGAIAQGSIAPTATCPYCQVAREDYDAP
jgi:hypothetical protein